MCVCGQIGGGVRFVGWGRIKKEKRKKEIQGGKGKDKYILYEERWIRKFLLWVVREKGGAGRNKIQVHMIESMYNQI